MSGPGPADRLAVRGGHRPHTAFGQDDEGLAVRTLVYRSADGHTWDALLVRPDGGPESPALAVLMHGSAGNYISGVPRRLAFELARVGHPVLSINTRMANFGAAYGSGLLDQVPFDIDGALELAAELGFGDILLSGYGLGATAVTHHQVLRRHPAVRGLLTFAHPSSLPDALRARWRANEASPTYEELEDEARRRRHEDLPDDIVVVARGAGPTDAPGDAEVWTYATWWASRGPTAAHAVSAGMIGEVRVPVALIQASTDDRLGYGAALASAARAGGARVHLERLSGTDHSLWDAGADAAARSARWIERQLPALVPRPCPRPTPARGTRHRLVTIGTPDGSEHDALLHEDPAASADQRADSLAVLHVHGNQGNFTVGSLRFLADPVAGAGAAILVLETRLSNVSQIFGGAGLPDALDDIRAAADWLVGHGHRRVVLSGYSLGAALAVRVAADGDAWLAGLMAFGASWSLPETTRRRMAATGAQPGYAELVERLRPIADRGRVGDPDDPMVVVRRAFGPRDEPRLAGVYTGRTWWRSRGPEAVDAEPRRHIGRVTVPTLLVQGTADEIVDPAEAQLLREAAGGPAELARIEGAGHSFHGGEAAVVAAVTAFLARLG